MELPDRKVWGSTYYKQIKQPIAFNKVQVSVDPDGRIIISTEYPPPETH